MPGDILDLKPLIRARAAAACTHEYVAVDMTSAELECVDCGAPLDPWWYIRKLAESDAAFRAHMAEMQSRFDAILLDGNAKIELLNAQIQRKNAEVCRLTDAWNDLANRTTPDGKILGNVARKRRRRTS